MEDKEKKNPIIKYLTKEEGHVIPEELFEAIKPILEDKQVCDYAKSVLRHAAGPITPLLEGEEHMARVLQQIFISGLAVGYMYGGEGNKSPGEIASQLLRDLNIKEGKDEH